MSSPAWAFFSAISLALIALLGKAIDGWFKERKNAHKVEVIEKAVQPISNGAIPSMAQDISDIKQLVISLVGRVDRLERIQK